jgi:uncharacterized protein YqjF (DUF2071 family)
MKRGEMVFMNSRRWIMYQRWHDLLFAHWALPAESVRPLIPPELELDTFDGQAWVGVIPFWMSRVHVRGLPPIPTAGTLPELNVRTYVRAPKGRTADQEKPGVYFFSLDAASILAVLGARAWVGLPYFYADMKADVAGDDEVRYRSRRRQSPRPAELTVAYRPVGPVSPEKTDLEYFLTERYCLYVVRSGRVYRLDIQHRPWPLQPAKAAFHHNTMAHASRIVLPDTEPVLHFAKFLEVYIFMPLALT